MASRPKPAETAPAPQAPAAPAADGDAELRFRVVRQEDWRKGIRLEQLYWNALGEAARASGETLAGLVRRIAGEDAEGNATARLRVAAARHLSDEAARLRGALNPRRVVAAMQAAPVPSFAVTRDRRIYSCNREFMALVHANLATGIQQTRGLDTVRLSFDVPIPRLLDVLNDSDKEAVLCAFRVNADGTGFSGNARVRLAPAAGEPILVAYVMPAKAQAG